MNPGTLNPEIIITMSIFCSLLRGPILKNQLDVHCKEGISKLTKKQKNQKLLKEI